MSNPQKSKGALVSSSQNSPLVNPHVEYKRRLEERHSEVIRLTRVSERVSTARLVVFLLAGMIVWFSIRPGILSGWWLLLPIGVFVGLIIFHERVRQALRQAGRAVTFYERGLARVEDRWSGQGAPGS